MSKFLQREVHELALKGALDSSRKGLPSSSSSLWKTKRSSIIQLDPAMAIDQQIETGLASFCLCLLQKMKCSSWGSRAGGSQIMSSSTTAVGAAEQPAVACATQRTECADHGEPGRQRGWRDRAPSRPASATRRPGVEADSTRRLACRLARWSSSGEAPLVSRVSRAGKGRGKGLVRIAVAVTCDCEI